MLKSIVNQMPSIRMNKDPTEPNKYRSSKARFVIDIGLQKQRLLTMLLRERMHTKPCIGTSVLGRLSFS